MQYSIKMTIGMINKEYERNITSHYKAAPNKYDLL